MHRLASQYAEYFNITDALEDDVSIVEATVERNLAQLDEFHLLMRSVREEQQQFNEQIVPELVKLSERMNEAFKQIDQVEEAIVAVRRVIVKSFERIEETDKAYSSNPLDKMLSSFRVPFFSVGPSSFLWPALS